MPDPASPMPVTASPPISWRRLLLVFAALVLFVFATRTLFYWRHGQILAGTHADEAFHYSAELLRLKPDHFRDDLSVQATLRLGEPYVSFYDFMVGLVHRTGATLLSVNALVCWAANILYLAGLFFVCRKLGLSPWLCALGTFLASQRYALMTAQTLVTHGTAIPREVWLWPMPWFLAWFLFWPRSGGRIFLFYAALGGVYTATYPLWAVSFGLLFGLVDFFMIVQSRRWRDLAGLAAGAAVCLAMVWLYNKGTVQSLVGEESVLLQRTKHLRSIYWTKVFRRFAIFSVVGAWAFWRLNRRGELFSSEPVRRMLGIFAVAVVIGCIYQPLEGPFRSLSVMYVGRVALVSFVVGFLAVVLVLRSEFRRYALWAKGLILASLAVFSIYPLLELYQERMPEGFLQAADYIREKTSIDASFLVPPVEKSQFFRIYAERAIYISPYDKTTLWTTKAVNDEREERVALMKQFYSPETTEEERSRMVDRLKKDGIDFILLPPKFRGAPQLIPVQKFSGWRICPIP